MGRAGIASRPNFREMFRVTENSKAEKNETSPTSSAPSCPPPSYNPNRLSYPPSCCDHGNQEVDVHEALQFSDALKRYSCTVEGGTRPIKSQKRKWIILGISGSIIVLGTALAIGVVKRNDLPGNHAAGDRSPAKLTTASETASRHTDKTHDPGTVPHVASIAETILGSMPTSISLTTVTPAAVTCTKYQSNRTISGLPGMGA